MKRTFFPALIAALALLSVATPGLTLHAAPSPEAAATVVVYNERDPVSLTLATSYAAKREIPYDHLVGIACPSEETILRADYDRTIAAPLRKQFVDRGWWREEPHPARLGEMRVAASTIRYVVLMRGVPLRMAPHTGSVYPGDAPDRVPAPLNRNESSVDSELALLGFNNTQVSGPLDNPFYRSAAPALAGGFPPGLLLVCRLDAASQGTVQRMIDDAVTAETNGLWGFAYLDSRAMKEGGLKEGDDWLRSISGELLRAGIPTIHEDSPEMFPDHYPMEHAALYFGWYSEHVSGPFRNPGFRFEPGAIAVHIHSFSASTLRLPDRQWCAPLLEKGAAATLGNVHEPYLHLTPHLDIFEERLRRGFNFAEAAYASQPALSWMSTFIGDPLYRPFKVRSASKGTAREFSTFREASKGWFGGKRAAVQQALMEKGKAMKSGVILEGLASLQLASRRHQEALDSLLLARSFYRNPDDQARCTLHAAGLMANLRKAREAQALLKEQIRTTPQTVALPLLQQFLDGFTPKPPQAPAPPR